MAKVKNTGNQARGFMTEDGGQVVVKPGEEKEFNMTEADFNKVKELAAYDDPPLFEISGSHGGVKAKTAKEQQEADQKKREAERRSATPKRRKTRRKLTSGKRSDVHQPHTAADCRGIPGNVSGVLRGLGRNDPTQAR